MNRINQGICVKNYFLYKNDLLYEIVIVLDYFLFYNYNTSDANETTLVKLKSLNSSGIAPKTLVPFGFPF